jgi:hypothetical protein
MSATVHLLPLDLHSASAMSAALLLLLLLKDARAGGFQALVPICIDVPLLWMLNSLFGYLKISLSSC